MERAEKALLPYLGMVNFHSIHSGVRSQDDEGELADDGSTQNHGEQEAVHEHLDKLEHFETALAAALSLSRNCLEYVPCRPVN